MREHVEADAGFGRLHRDAAHELEMAGEVTKLLVLEVRDLDAEEVSELHEHLVHRSIASPLADAVDARGENFSSGPQRHDGVPGAETEVIMEMDDQRRVGGGRFDLGDVLAHGERRVTTHGVRSRRASTAGLQAFAVDLADIVDIRATPIFPTELYGGGALLARVADRLAHHPKVGRAVVRHGQLQPLGLGNAVPMQQRLAQLVLDVQVGCRGEDEVRHLVALVPKLVDDAHRGVDVALGRAHHANHLEVGPDLATLAPFENEPQGFALALGDRREADIHDVDPDVGEHARKLVLGLRRDGDPGHLLAIAEGVVVDANLAGGRELKIVAEVLGVSGQLCQRLLELDRLDAVHAQAVRPAVCRRSSSRLRTHGTSPPIWMSSFMKAGKASQRYSSPLVKLRTIPSSRSTSSSSPSDMPSAACGDWRMG